MSNTVYADARAKSLCNHLINKERLNRMIESTDADEAFRILAESNFGGGGSFYSVADIEDMIFVEKTALANFIREECPVDNIKKFLLYKNDFNNAESFIKSKHLKIDDSKLVDVDGVFDKKTLKEKIFIDDYSKLPKAMAQALLECDEEFVSKRATGVSVNATIQKAYFIDLYDVCESKLLKQLYCFKADTTNISISLRTRNYSIANRFFVNNGNLKTEDLKVLCDRSYDEIREKFRFSSLKEAIDEAVIACEKKQALSRFEKIVDDYALITLYKERFSTDKTLPFISYCLYKQAELKNVRIIITGLINGLEKENIKNRLRFCYEG